MIVLASIPTIACSHFTSVTDTGYNLSTVSLHIVSCVVHKLSSVCIDTVRVHKPKFDMTGRSKPLAKSVSASVAPPRVALPNSIAFLGKGTKVDHPYLDDN